MTYQIFLLVTATALIVIGALVVLRHFNRLDKRKYRSPYLRRRKLFSSSAESQLFITLNSLYGGEYYVFPHVHFSALVEVDKKKVDWKDVPKYRSRADRKSAEFVLCEKESYAPVLLVELGGELHNFPDKTSRESFMKDIGDIEGLPLVTLGGNVGEGAVQRAVGDALARK